MLNLASIAKKLRTSIGRFTSEPDVAVLAFGLVNAKGTVGATIDPNTGQMATSVNALSASGAVPVVGGKYAITKSSAIAALTLAAPNSGTMDGVKLEFVSSTAYAHTITAMSLLNNGGSGVPYTTATFAAHAGASITLMAYQGLWYVLSIDNVTLS
jgi:hypothetical protein